MNCACAYYDTAEHNLLILLLLRTALAPYWQSLVHLNCACSITIRYHYTRSRKSKWPEVFVKCQVRWAIITAISTFSDWIRVYAEKLVNAPKSNKIEYAPMHTIRVITSPVYLLIAPRLRLGFASATPRLSLALDLLRALSLVA